MFSPRRHSISQTIWAFLVSVAFLAGVFPTGTVDSQSSDGPVAKWLGGTGLDVSVRPKASNFSPTFLTSNDIPVVLSQAIVTDSVGSYRPSTASVWCMSRKMRLSISPGHSPPAA